MEEKETLALINSYLKKHRYYEKQIATPPDPLLNLIIVIPARAEPDLFRTLESIYSADKCQKAFEVIIVLNHPENESENLKDLNKATIVDYESWISKNGVNNCYLIKAFDLPAKHAGVGLARKIGMDEAVDRLKANSNGLILALDADCYVEKNYLVEIEKAFESNKKYNAASIYFEHPLDELEEGLRSGIIAYELHLRYYNQLLRYAEHPFAYHTVGSSMAVRSEAYQKQGGMNKRKAGEDFYFLQKLIQAGGFIEINSTCVYPSGRVSDRVPFGTGRAQGDWLNNQENSLLSYHPDSGLALKSFFRIIEDSYDEGVAYERIPDSVIGFIGEDQLREKLLELKSNTSNKKAFRLRFFQWFNLFMCFKFVHYYRDNVKENIPINECSYILLNSLGIEGVENKDTLGLLNVFRKWERSGSVGILS